MDEGRWKELDELLEGALSVEPHERAGYLERHCPDPDMRGRIERLIAAAESDGPFATGGAFAQTPAEEIPTLLEDEAERSLLEANRVVTGALGEDRPDARAAATITADLYGAWGKPEEEAVWRAQAEATPR